MVIADKKWSMSRTVAWAVLGAYTPALTSLALYLGPNELGHSPFVVIFAPVFVTAIAFLFGLTGMLGVTIAIFCTSFLIVKSCQKRWCWYVIPLVILSHFTVLSVLAYLELIDFGK